MGHQEHKILCAFCALCTFEYLAFCGQILQVREVYLCFNAIINLKSIQ